MRPLPCHRALLGLVLLVLVPPAAAQLAFTDATVDAGLLPTTPGGSTPPGMRPGAAVGDFDRDGWQDLFVLCAGDRPDALFMNNGDGTFTNRAAEWGVARVHKGGGACVGDYDGDGWLDIYVTSGGGGAKEQTGQNVLWRNSGKGYFVNRAHYAGVDETGQALPPNFGCSFGDYDLDGDLDLVVAGWYPPGDPGNGGNKLFRNDGNGRFTDATWMAGLRPALLHGFSPSFVDMNGDRYPELLFVADFKSSRYFVNNGDGTFADWTRVAGVSQESNGMGSATGDFDGDGLTDWYVTSVNFNKLYLNQGGHDYEEVAAQAGVTAGHWGWGTAAVDVDLDGWLDIVETNGWQGVFEFKNAKLWLNNANRTFTEVAPAVGLDHILNGLGLLNLDYDEDGDQDVLMTAAGVQHLRLYRNDQTTGRHWLRVVLDTAGSPGLAPDGFGSRVRARVGGRWLVRQLTGETHYLTTSEPVVHFGLGAANSVDELVVEWADGSQTQLKGVAVDQRIVVKSY